MFDKLVKYAKSAKEALEAVCTKRSASTKPSEPEPTTEQVETPKDDKPFTKPEFPIATIVFLAVIIGVSVYVEWHLLAISLGIGLVLLLMAYLMIQKTVDAANLAVPDPGGGSTPGTSDDTGGYHGA